MPNYKPSPRITLIYYNHHHRHHHRDYHHQDNIVFILIIIIIIMPNYKNSPRITLTIIIAIFINAILRRVGHNNTILIIIFIINFMPKPRPSSMISTKYLSSVKISFFLPLFSLSTFSSFYLSLSLLSCPPSHQSHLRLLLEMVIVNLSKLFSEHYHGHEDDNFCFAFLKLYFLPTVVQLAHVHDDMMILMITFN